MGERPSADDRAQDNGGDSFSAEELTADTLIQRYLQSDFNRRPDSYEIAGRFLADFLDTDVDIVEFFRKHEAYKYSERQQTEIILLIENALRLKEKEKAKQDGNEFILIGTSGGEQMPNEPTESPYAGIEIPTNMEPVFPTEIVEDITPPEETPEIDFSKPTEEEVKTVSQNQPADDTVIVKNEAVVTTDLPPITDENIIFGVLKQDQFFHIKKDRIAAFFENNTDHDERVEFVKGIFNSDYSEVLLGDTEDSRYGYKTYDEGLHIWKGSYLTRTMESGFSWEAVQSFYADMVERGLLLDTLVSEIDEPVFAEPIEQKKYPEPEEKTTETPNENEGAEQLSFFGEPVPVEQTAKRPKKSSKAKTPAKTPMPNFLITEDMKKYVLRCGSPERGSLSRIVAQFQKGKSIAENVEFLRKEFGSDGRGYVYNTPDFSETKNICSWFDDNGIIISAGENVVNP
ncbi:MAG: N-6 DNA methylase, partial [Ruminococcus sp.]|nr:N-6 DNA methylase [Ruminococcus sp.]